MAKRKKTGKRPAAISIRMKKHLEALGLTGERAYMRWCVDNGFEPSLDKTRDELETESHWKRHTHVRAKARSRIHRNPKKLIEHLCQGTLGWEAVERPGWREFAAVIATRLPKKALRPSLQDLLLLVHERADFMVETVTFGNETLSYAGGLIAIHERRRQWMRPIEDWHPKSHNSARQFSSLLRHLFAEYPVPVFMDSAWLRNDADADDFRNWFVHIGAGHNIRTAKTPIQLTKRMAHHFLDAPDGYAIEDAIRWGQVHALGGDRRLTEAILGSALANRFGNNQFWQTVIKFFIANPMLDRSHVGPIIDYIHDQKFVWHEVAIAPGVIERQPPPQPGLTMRGRTPETLLAQVEAWHRELGRARGVEKQQFKGSGLKPFEYAVDKERRNVWHIRELLSGKELIAEGRKMRHCVATYANSCAQGHCSIWAMEKDTPEGTEKRLTIEVTRHGAIVQCRGRRNRQPNIGEYEIVRRWADEAGLTISRYVGFE